MNPVERTLRIDPGAAYFADHFPGDPMVPGAALLALIVDELIGCGALGGFPIEVSVAKFVSPVRPGQTLRLSWSPAGRDLRFECHADGLLAASGKLRAVTGPPA